MRFIFYSPDDGFETWDWRNPDEKGIGGSETSHIEMARRLKARGHEVLSYNNLPADSPGEWHGIPWRHFRECKFEEEGIWVFYRCPALFTKLEKKPGQIWWLILQDWDYWADWKAVAEKVDRVWALSKSQLENLEKVAPDLNSVVNLTSNGIKLDLIESVEQELGAVKRDPYKVMFTSSPDRGLLALAKIFKKAREYESRLNLHVFYGFDNIDKVIARGEEVSKYALKVKEDTLKALDQPGVTWHGRVPQRTLTEHWLSTGIWCYPCVFHETSCITCMEAQACGAIPLINPVYAQGENTHHGLFIEGDCERDTFTQARFAIEMARLAGDEVLQQKIRPAMMADAMKRFDWERFVSQWISTAYYDVKDMKEAMGE